MTLIVTANLYNTFAAAKYKKNQLYNKWWSKTNIYYKAVKYANMTSSNTSCLSYSFLYCNKKELQKLHEDKLRTVHKDSETCVNQLSPQKNPLLAQIIKYILNRHKYFNNDSICLH